MKKVTSFNRQNIRQINSELEAALKQVAEKYGLEVLNLVTLALVSIILPLKFK